ncbi:proliferating cell nuclear antigen, N-terminal domain-containing protein [Lipomyces chichibuensis]|uniref:proliferating cell nuclear antigen, N-terminal domain-containing protein n=1 Tax=Lipomyces chichibuensis TaxID=1546026 RepID=UPI0033439EE9
MLEGKLEQASLFKKVVEAVRELVQDCNFDCTENGLALQAMDTSHVSLVSLLLTADGFSEYRCDRNLALGINLVSLTKILRCGNNEDILTLEAGDSADSLVVRFENTQQDRMSEYALKLMDIDQEHLGIPETEYAASITMPSTEFQRICRDMQSISESITIDCTKGGVRFTCEGDIGNGSVTLKPNSSADKPELCTKIDLSEPVSLTLSTKYLLNFCKATGLSQQVTLKLADENPILVEYPLSAGHLRFYLAPKLDE